MESHDPFADVPSDPAPVGEDEESDGLGGYNPSEGEAPEGAGLLGEDGPPPGEYLEDPEEAEDADEPEDEPEEEPDATPEPEPEAETGYEDELEDGALMSDNAEPIPEAEPIAEPAEPEPEPVEPEPIADPIPEPTPEPPEPEPIAVEEPPEIEVEEPPAIEPEEPAPIEPVEPEPIVEPEPEVETAVEPSEPEPEPEPEASPPEPEALSPVPQHDDLFVLPLQEGATSKRNRNYIIFEGIPVTVDGEAKLAFVRVGQAVGRNGEVARRRGYRALCGLRNQRVETILWPVAETNVDPQPVKAKDDAEGEFAIQVGVGG